MNHSYFLSHITHHSLAFHWDKSAGSQSQGGGHQHRWQHRELGALWQKCTVEKGTPSPHLVLIMENNAGCFAKYQCCCTEPLLTARWVRLVYFIEVLISASDWCSTTPGSRLNRISRCRWHCFAENMRLLSHFESCILPHSPLVRLPWLRLR